MEQPLRKCILSSARAGGGEQFEQAALAEQIEVFGIRMRQIAEALARFAAARPQVFDAGEASLVIARRTRGEFPIADDALMNYD